MSSNVFVGLVVASSSQSTLNTAQFDNVSVVNALDFMLSVYPGVVTGSSVQYSVNVSALAGFSSTVNFSLAGLPSGATYTFAPASLTASGSTTLTVTSPANIPAGVYPLTINAVGGSTTHSAVASLILTGSPAVLWSEQNVGNALSGGVTYASNALSIQGSGSGIENTAWWMPNADTFHFVAQPMAADGTVIARVVSTTGGLAGVMIRDSADPSGANVFVGLMNSTPE